MHLHTGTPDLLTSLKLDPDYEVNPIVFGVKMPEKVHVFDMFYNAEKFIWQNWSQTVPPFQIPKNISYNDVISHRKHCFVEEIVCIFGCNNGMKYKGREELRAHVALDC